MKNIRILFALLPFALASCHFMSALDPVNYNQITSLTFSKNSLSMPQGGMDMITVSIDPPDRQGEAAIEWSYDASVIDVQADNYTLIITGLKPGETIIRGTASGISSSCVVSITEGSLTPVITDPYIYSNTEIISLAPGETVRAAASLYGGASADMNGFTFSIDKSTVATLTTEGNYVWVTGREEGMARVSIRHNRAAYAYTFLVSCRPDGQTVPYITTAQNVITVNKSTETESAFTVELQNPPSPGAESLFTYKVTDEFYGVMDNPPFSIAASGKRIVITPLHAGAAYIQASHPSAPYALDVLVRVIEQLDAVYISPSDTVLYVPGASAQTLSVSLVNVPANVTANQNDFSWTFPPEADDHVSYTVFGGSEDNKGNSLWITGKKSGSFRLTVTHPLAVYSRDVFVVVKNIAGEASDASTFITTSQNYITAKPGDEDIKLSIFINNAEPGAESGLHWQILNDAADGSSNPVISFSGGTGTSASASARSAAPVQIATGYAVISPKQEGTAVITISHPKALYDTKVMVVVTAAQTAQDAPLAISTNSLLNLVQNGQSINLSVSLTGPGVSPGDYSGVIWHTNSPNVSISPNGLDATVAASGSGTGKETITVSHPRAAWPLQITVIRYDTPEDLADKKYIIANNPYLTLLAGFSAYLYLDIFNLAEENIVTWNVQSGGNSVISFTQESKSRAVISGLAAGTAVVTASFGGETASWYINVKISGAIDESIPAYLSTGQNVVVLQPGSQEQVFVTPINIATSQYAGISWTNSNPDLIDLIPNGASAAVQSKAAAGTATLTVSHPLAANILEITVHVGDQYVYKNNDVAFISVPSNTLILTNGSADTVFQAALAHTESPEVSTDGFLYAASDPTVASVSSSGPAALITPRKPGQTKLLISHPQADSGCEVLVVVEPAEGETGSPYITTAQNVVTVISGETVPVSVSLKNKNSYNAADWSWSSLDHSVASIAANNGTAAMIRGEQPGTSYIRVSNVNALHSLELIVICLDANAVQAHPWIKTSTNIVNLKVNDSATITAEMIGGAPSDASAFVWSAQDSTAVFLSGSGPSVFVKGIRAGLSYITVRNNNYPDAYTKTVLVLVEDAAKEECYITVSQSIIKLKPNASGSVNIKAALAGGGVLDPEHFVWWADDYQLISLTALTDTAQVTPLGRSGITSIHVKHPKALNPVDMLVVISSFDKFGFSTASKTISQGGVCFIPMQVPPTVDPSTVAYSSANQSVCAVTGSTSVAMIAGVTNGQTIITATMKDSKGVVLGTSELAVIVSYVPPDENKIVSKISIVNMELNTSQTLQASLSGPGIGPSDDYDVKWSSSDPSILSILATEQNVTRGRSAYVTAKGAGEAVITLSHPKCKAEEQIWVLIPEQHEAGITLDETYIEMYKDEGSRAITAALTNAKPGDYDAVVWTAPKVGGQVIISVSKAQGKVCNIVPRNVGQTTLRAQLPSGAYADCIISVRSAAEINLETLAVHINPGYTETVHFTTNPETANVTWIGMGNNGGDVSNIFSFTANDAAKTLSITGKNLGNGYIQGYFASSQGSSTKQLQVFVEYNYQFDLKTSGYITREPLPGTVIQIPFTVHPKDMAVTAFSSDESKMIIKSISQNAVTGEGMVEVTPLGEKNNLYVRLQAKNPQDMVNPPIERTQYINLRYETLAITPVFDYVAGSFTEYKNGVLYLGDGEEKLFHFDVSQPNAQVDSLQVEWINGNNEDTKSTGGFISLSKEGVNGDTGKQMWRVKHNKDHIDPDTSRYYLISKAMKFRVSKTSYSVQEKSGSYTIISPWNGDKITNTYTYYVQNQPQTTPQVVLDTEASQGVSEWYLYRAHWDNGKPWGLGLTYWYEDRVYGRSSNDVFNSILENLIDPGAPGDNSVNKVTSFSGATGEYHQENPSSTPTFSQTAFYKGDIYSCETFYEDITPYVISVEDFNRNPNFFRPYFEGRYIRENPVWGAMEEDYKLEFPEQKLHRHADSTTSKDEGFQGEYDASIAVSYQRFNGEKVTMNIPVKVQKRMCEAYSKGRWKLVGNKYIMQY
jgi:hypothetical protein